jgi:predicted transcriptional regulator
MKKPRSDPTDAELSVLKVLWQRGPSSIRQIVDELYPGGSASEYSTVQKLLERLEGKSFVRRRPQGRMNVFTAAIEREGLIARRLRETADRLCEGSLTPLLTHLVHRSKLTAEEISELRKLVDRSESDRMRS